MDRKELKGIYKDMNTIDELFDEVDSAPNGQRIVFTKESLLCILNEIIEIKKQLNER